jgi:hypothetical protein
VRFLICSAVALLAIASPAEANETCPPRESGTFPWTSDGALPGDQYGWVYLTMGKNRRPVQCGIGQTNISDTDLRFFVCRAMLAQWEPGPKEDPAPGSVVKRLFILPGLHHDKVFKEARKRFFEEHPDQRPECYPEK